MTGGFHSTAGLLNYLRLGNLRPIPLQRLFSGLVLRPFLREAKHSLRTGHLQLSRGVGHGCWFPWPKR